MKIMILFLFTLLLAIHQASWSATIEYFNEAQFQNAAGLVNVFDFEDRPNDAPLASDYYSSQGLTIVNRDGGSLNTTTMLWYSNQVTSQFRNGPYPVVNLDFIFSQPVWAAGLYAIDFYYDLTIEFLDVNNQVIASEFFSNSHPQAYLTLANYSAFYGITSDIPIARIRSIDINNGGDWIGFDNVQFSLAIPEPGVFISMVLGLIFFSQIKIFKS